jgi:DnaA-homolog protein
VKQLVLEILPPATPSFANFVVGRNVEAVAALFEAANGRSSLGLYVVYLWGEVGAGKTHLLHAMADAHANIEIADDVERLDDGAQIALFNQINQVNQCDQASEDAQTSRLVVAAGNVAPRDLPLRPELSSRLGSGLVFQIHPLSDEEKAAALHAHAKARALRLHDDVVAHLLRYSRRDMPTLIATLDALDRYSLETGREITLPLLKQMSQPSLL